MSVVRLPHRTVVIGTSDPHRPRVRFATAVQVIAVSGAFVLGIALALMLPGTARGADPAPVSAADAYDAPHVGPLVVDATRGVLANDTGLGITAELWNDADHGTVTLAPDGSFTYDPTEPATTDTFAYLATDQDGVAAEPVKVRLHVVNEPPMCTGVQLLDQPAGTEIQVDLRDACVDADGDPLVFEYQRPDVPDDVAFDVTPRGLVTLLAPAGWDGTAAVMFTATDGRSTSMPTLAAIGVIPAE